MDKLPDTPRKRGRKPTGRVTAAFNMRMEVTMKRRLKEASTKERPQSTIVEEALDKVLPCVTTTEDPLS